MKGTVRVFLLLSAVCAALGCGTTERAVRFPAIYLDMDGTALGADHRVRPATALALERVRACGGHVGIATARTLEQVKPHLRVLKPDLPLVLFNGAAVYDAHSHAVIEARNLSKEDLAAVVDALEHVGGITGAVAHYPEANVVRAQTPAVRRFLDVGGVTAHAVCPQLDDCRPNAAPATGGPVKVLVLVEAGAADTVAAELHRRTGGRITAVVSNERAIEIVPRGVNKAVALARILQRRGLRPADVLVFGDSRNDTEMVSTIPVSVAMGNCHPDTCEAALFKTGRHDTDAIARIIERLVILPGCAAP